MTRVLIADDETRRLVTSVPPIPRTRGLEVSVARDGNEALRMADYRADRRRHPRRDDAWTKRADACRSLRERSGYALPVILLTALGEEGDRIAGLEAGRRRLPDQSRSSSRELALRVRSVLRRSPSPGDTQVVVSLRRADGCPAGRPLGDRQRQGPSSLTNREFDLLLFLLHPPGVSCSAGRNS